MEVVDLDMALEGLVHMGMVLVTVMDMGMEVVDLDMALEGLVHMGMVLVTVLVDTGSEDFMVLGMVVVMDNLNTQVKRMLSNQPTKLKRKRTHNLNQRTLQLSRPMLHLSQLTRSLRQRIHKLSSPTLNIKLMYSSPQHTLKLQLFNNR